MHEQSSLGVPDVRSTAPAAFIASYLSTIGLQQDILQRDHLRPPGLEAALQGLTAQTLGAVDDPSGTSRATGAASAGKGLDVSNTSGGSSSGGSSPAQQWTLALLHERRPTQHQLMLRIHAFIFDQLVARSSTLNKTRLRSVAMRGSGDFLEAEPLQWNAMAPREFSTAVRLRVGLPVYNKAHVCPMCREALCDREGHHSLVCGNHGDRIHRHNVAGRSAR